MWFVFPKGTSGVSIQQQEFKPELKDDETGEEYFRAPDHFAAILVGMLKFNQKTPPERLNPPADLPKPDPDRDGAIGKLAHDLAGARADVEALRADNRALTNENSELRKQNHLQEQIIGALRQRLEDADIDPDKEEELTPPVGKPAPKAA